MAIPKIYRIAELSYLDGSSPDIRYINVTKNYKNINQVKNDIPSDSNSKLYIIVEIKGVNGDQKKVKNVT